MLRKLTLSSLLLFPLGLAAQTANDYVHRGAQKYIFGDEPGAKSEFVEGLQKFPTDEELRQLLALIREQQKKQQQQSDKSDDKDQKQDQKSEQKKDEQNQESKSEQDKKDGQKPEPKNGQQQEQKGGSKEKESKGEKGEEVAPPEKKPDGELKANPSDTQAEKEAKEAKEAEAEQAAEARGEMTERQAKALLDSLKSEDERVHLIDPKDRKRAHGTFRDW